MLYLNVSNDDDDSNVTSSTDSHPTSSARKSSDNLYKLNMMKGIKV